jgi:polyribonucleotide 5'-hydroxyl-kinase
MFSNVNLCFLFLASMVIRRPASVEDGFRIEMPLVFHYGYKTPAENIGLYNEIVSSMATYVNIRSENVEKCEKYFFLIINVF